MSFLLNSFKIPTHLQKIRGILRIVCYSFSYFFYWIHLRFHPNNSGHFGSEVNIAWGMYVQTRLRFLFSKQEVVCFAYNKSHNIHVRLKNIFFFFSSFKSTIWALSFDERFAAISENFTILKNERKSALLWGDAVIARDGSYCYYYIFANR